MTPIVRQIVLLVAVVVMFVISMGHDAGVEVLKIVAMRLKDSVRTSDTVARIGGDEFTVIATDMANRENAGFIAARLLASM